MPVGVKRGKKRKGDPLSPAYGTQNRNEGRDFKNSLTAPITLDLLCGRDRKGKPMPRKKRRDSSPKTNARGC